MIHNNEAVSTDGTSQHGQAVVHKNMQELFNLSVTDESLKITDVTPNPYPVDPLLLTPEMVVDILQNYYQV